MSCRVVDGTLVEINLIVKEMAYFLRMDFADYSFCLIGAGLGAFSSLMSLHRSPDSTLQLDSTLRSNLWQEIREENLHLGRFVYAS